MGEQVCHCDETGWKVYEPVEGKADNRWWLWVFHNPSSPIYRLEPTRSRQVPIDHFQDVCSPSEEVFVICDRFGAHRRLSKKIESITLSYCWAHVRRDFWDAATKYRQLASWSQDWLQRIGSLYHLNQTRLAHWQAERSMADQSERFQSQQRLLEQAIESLEQTRQLAYLEEDIHPAQRKVLKSMLKHWTGLKVCVEHAPISMDNNTAERSIRNPAMFRKNCRGSGSFWSAGLAAMMVSIFQTLLQWRINPQHGLYAYFQACAGQQGQVPLLQLHTFVPWQMSEPRRQQLSQPIDMRRDLGLDPWPQPP